MGLLAPNAKLRSQVILSSGPSAALFEQLCQAQQRMGLDKEQFDEFWGRGSSGSAAKLLDAWIREALETEIRPLVKVAKTLQMHRRRLLAYHVHHMTNGPLEGLNTEIDVLRRSRYGFRDLEYFGMKIRQLSIERSPRQVGRARRLAAQKA